MKNGLSRLTANLDQWDFIIQKVHRNKRKKRRKRKNK